MRFVELNNGRRMPMLGFGVYRLSEPRLCERAVGQALEAGYRLIDTAAAYLNEGAVGAAIAASGVPREELFITSKLWLTDASREGAGPALRQSLKRLRLDYLDLYLVHQPWGEWHGAWRALEEALAEGLVRAVGVSNFAADRVAELMALHPVHPAVDQIEINPLCQRRADRAYLAARGVVAQAWAPLAQGKDALFENPELTAIARRHGRTVAQVILAWLLQSGIPALTQTTRPERLRENLEAFSLELGEDELAAVTALDTGRSCFYSHTDPEIVEKFCTARAPGREALLRACRAAQRARSQSR